MRHVIEEYFGLEFTDELKGKSGEAIPDFRALEDGSFLGRKFRPGTFRGLPKIFAPLRMYSVIEHLQWTKGDTNPEIETAKFELTNLELGQYPSDVFYSKVPRYAEACFDCYGLRPKYTDYETAVERSMMLSSERYSFETFLIEETYKESDLQHLKQLLS